ncbi:berberine bridge enzyme-like 22 [Herrania umbratica]|uniref:Berberine bridge enzyme-like 22 n=1 Tax=Herrania umbratica TaxID=108875 RepID=A0A6J1BF80_9ROSI|nr:berberine bridge enzyme-like 22 [Herrania umbratica]
MIAILLFDVTIKFCRGDKPTLERGLLLKRSTLSKKVQFKYILKTHQAISDSIHGDFVRCMSTQFRDYTRSFEIIFTSDSPLYSSILRSTLQNMRWLNSSTSTPLLIITPFHESEIHAALLCSKKLGLQIRVRSGGHDYEGLSYSCKTPFIIIDLTNLRAIEINVEEETAWVQSGATLGELYYAIGKKSSIHAFPAGLCPTVGVGGHFSGGGLGTLMRKYGLAADNVLDAYLVDVNGRILDRKAMGENLFWAIRGGGGASFGIILSWKIRLVRVPPTVTAFTISKTIEQGATKLVHRWQYIADKLPEDLFIRVIIQDVPGSGHRNNKTIQASFNSLFLGEIDRLIPFMNESFPVLGLLAEDCIQMSWVESTLYFAGFQQGQPLEALLDKTQLYKSSFKAKSDFVREPIPEEGLEGIWKMFLAEEMVFIIMDPFGGKMNTIPESAVPFPHRKENLYNIQYIVKWQVNDVKASHKHIYWIRMLYEYMSPYVSKAPRAAYLNYRDLDLGTNSQGSTSYAEASEWGKKYFKGNFKRLARVKSMTDPQNFFRNEQSIPPLPTPGKRKYK